MGDNKEILKYGSHVTKEMIEEVVNDIYVHTKNKDRDFKFKIFFKNQKQADDWMKMFNNLLKEEAKKLFK